MKNIELQKPEFPGDHYYCATSATVVVLNGRYDPNQYWLSFSEEVLVFRHEQIAPPPSRSMKRDTVKRKLERPLRPLDIHLNWYEVERDVHQYPLPIPEWQMPARSLSKRIQQADCPCFERDEQGRLYTLDYAGAIPNGGLRTIEAVREWIQTNCEGRVILNKRVVFERQTDALMAQVSGIFSKHAR